MSAHEIYAVMKGKNLSHYTEEGLLSILNKGFKYPWYYQGDELSISDDEIYIYTENKNNNLQKLIKNIKENMPEVDELLWEVKPYWADPSTDEFQTELAYWTKNEEYKKAIYWDKRWGAIYLIPHNYDITKAYEQAKANLGDDMDEGWLGSDTHDLLVDKFFTELRNHKSPGYYQEKVGKGNI